MRISRSFLMLSVLAVAAAAEISPPTAQQQLENLRTQIRAARANGDWHSSLDRAKDLKGLLNGSPNSLLEVARAEIHVGDLNAASDELELYAHMGQSTNLVDTSAEFSALGKGDRWAGIREEMKANLTPKSLATTAITLSDPNLLAEDIDYDSNSRRFFMTSVREKKIIAVDSKGRSSDFAKAPDDWPMLAIKIDPSASVVWATEVALQGFSIAPEQEWGRTAVLCFDLKTGKLLKRIEGPEGSAFGDMALTADGDAIVSDGDGGGVYRVASKGTTLERMDNGDFISPQTPAIDPDGKHIFVPDYLRGIGVLEMGSKQVRWLSTGGRFALNGIDGLYFYRGTLIAVQNGTFPERVVAFRLDPALTSVISETVIERATSTIGDPTHGVMIGNKLFYIANSGWDVTDDHGNLKQGAKASVPNLMCSHFRGGTWSSH